MGEQQARTFQMSFSDGLWTAAGIALAYTFGFGLVWLVVGRWKPDVLIAIALPWAFYAIRTKRKISLTREWIEGPSGHQVRWQEIDRAAFVAGPFGGLQVGCCAERIVTVAPSIARDPDFRAAVLAYAPPHSEIVKAISQRYAGRS